MLRRQTNDKLCSGVNRATLKWKFYDWILIKWDEQSSNIHEETKLFIRCERAVISRKLQELDIFLSWFYLKNSKLSVAVDEESRLLIFLIYIKVSTSVWTALKFKWKPHCMAIGRNM